MSMAFQCPRCHAAIQAGQPVCSTCGLALDPASLAAFQAEQQRLGIGAVQATPSAAQTRSTSGWGCLGSIFELIGSIFDIFD